MTFKLLTPEYYGSVVEKDLSKPFTKLYVTLAPDVDYKLALWSSWFRCNRYCLSNIFKPKTQIK